jgi:cytochrome c oxidase assembly protein subunit 15
VRWLVVAAVVLVVVQGALGGLRVILDDKTVAKVHACTGPLFFAVATAIAVLSGRRGRGDTSAAATEQSDAVGQQAFDAVGPVHLRLPSWAVGASLPTALAVAAYLQLVAGAQLRHADATLAPSTFRWMVAIHLAGAVAVTVLSGLTVIAWQPHESRVARRWSLAIMAMVMGQLLLGGGAWLFTWGVPSWLQDAWAPAEAVLARSPRGAAVITGHVILGMMILGAAVVLALEWGGADRLERIARLGRRGLRRPDGTEASLFPATVAIRPRSERGAR